MREEWDVKQVPSQPGNVAIVTGANNGIGYETALELARKDLTVVLACRDMGKAEAAKARILQAYAPAQVHCLELDVSSLRAVREFAAQIHRQHGRLDLLVNNAGIMMPPYAVSEDGFELQLATNYLGHFALTGSPSRPACARMATRSPMTGATWPAPSRHGCRPATRCCPR